MQCVKLCRLCQDYILLRWRLQVDWCLEMLQKRGTHILVLRHSCWHQYNWIERFQMYCCGLMKGQRWTACLLVVRIVCSLAGSRWWVWMMHWDLPFFPMLADWGALLCHIECLFFFTWELWAFGIFYFFLHSIYRNKSGYKIVENETCIVCSDINVFYALKLCITYWHLQRRFFQHIDKSLRWLSVIGTKVVSSSSEAETQNWLHAFNWLYVIQLLIVLGDCPGSFCSERGRELLYLQSGH